MHPKYKFNECLANAGGSLEETLKVFKTNAYEICLTCTFLKKHVDNFLN